MLEEVEADAATAEPQPLPRAYRTQTLWLMPRDPESLFAFWDIDWQAAFGVEAPTERKVHLRVLRSDGSEETALEVEPMAGNCAVIVSSGDESYTADLGFYRPASRWNSIAQSASALMPTDEPSEIQNPEFATIPIHVSFQRLIDAFRASRDDTAPITQILSDLRERVHAPDDTKPVTAEEREIVQALETAAASPATATIKSPQPDLWARMEADRVLGFGGTSPTSGFGASSRAL